MALYKTEGIVVRTRNLGEADRIITLYTRDRGKVEGVARGSRRARSRLMGATQLFTYGNYLMYSGRSLDTISQAEIQESFAGLRDDLIKMAHASYIAELLDLSVEPEEPSEDLFALLYESFTALDQDKPPEIVLRWFELHLMVLLGYQPELRHCVGCGSVASEARFSVREGGLLCPRCLSKDPTAIAVRPSTIQWMKQLMLAPAQRLGVMRPSLDDSQALETVGRAYIDYRLARPLKSLDFLASIKDLA
jgi:DNA repair protein RecO